MRLVQNCIVFFGLLFIALINILPDFFYVGRYHPVGEEAVKVYEAASLSDGPATPVFHLGGGAPMKDTGQRVCVYLRSSYRDEHLLAKPNLTLILIGGLAALYLLVSVMARFTEQRGPSQNIAS